MSGLLRYRVLWSLALGAAIILPTGLYAPRNETGLPRGEYDAMRYAWRHCADCVIAGDSRARSSLSPAALHEAGIPGRVLNFAHAGCALTPDYLERVAEVLDPASQNPTIILGITPRAFTRYAARPEVNSFKMFQEDPPKMAARWQRFLGVFDPLPLDRVQLGIGERNCSSLMRFDADGFVAGTQVPEDETRELAEFRDLFAAGGVDHDIIAALFDQVRAWQAAGIAVYAYRPPTTEAMIKLENDLGGFDETAFAAAFRQAGGAWIDVDQTGYHSFDGSHLRYDAAIEFSHDFAAAMLDAESGGAVAQRR